MTHIIHKSLFFFVAVNLFAAFMLGVFFRGFDQAIFAPALVAISLSSFLLILPGIRRGWKMPKSMTALFLLLYWVWIGISLFWSGVPYISILFALLIGSLPLLFFSIVQNNDSDHITRFFSAALTVAIGIIAIWALIQYFFLSEHIFTRINHPMLNANNLAVIIAMGFFLALGHFIRAHGALKIGLGALMVLMAGGVMVTQSRGGTLALVLGAVFFLVFNFRMICESWRLWAFLALVTILFSCGLIWDMQERYTNLHILGGADGQRSIDVRMVLWQSSLQMFRENIFPGIGLGVFYLVFPSYRHSDDISDGYFAHLDPLQFGIEMGFPILIFFYGFCICVLLRTLRSLKSDNSLMRADIVAPFCGLVALLTNAHLNFDLYMLPAQMMGTVLLCRWYLATEKTLGQDRLHISIRNPRWAVAAIPVILLLYVAVPVWVIRAGVAVKYTNDALRLTYSGDLEEAYQVNLKAEKIGPESYYRTFYQKGVWATQTLQKNFFSLSATRREELYKQAIAELDRAISMNKYYTQAMNYKAMTHFLAYPRIDQNGIAKAQKVMEDAYAIDPVSFDVMMGLARIFEAQGNISRASEIMESGQKWLVIQHYAPPAYDEYRAHLREKLGDKAGAADIRSKILEKVRGNQIRSERLTRFDTWLRIKIDMMKRGL